MKVRPAYHVRHALALEFATFALVQVNVLYVMVSNTKMRRVPIVTIEEAV